MMTWKLVGWLRMGLASILALAPLAVQHRALDAGPGTSGGLAIGELTIGELAIDVDGDGRADRVRWARHDDAFWLDVALTGPGGPQATFTPDSSTRVAVAAPGACWSLSAADLNRDGRTDVIVRDASGRATAWLSDGRAFAADAALEAGAQASTPK